MATIAPRRPAWSLPAVAGDARLLAPVAVGALVLLSIVLRTRDFDVGFWIDEGLSVGIADRPLSEIPAALRLDGSPPLYYSLLHAWIALFGTSEPATHALSLVFAVLAVPAAWWAARGLFGPKAALLAALLAATNPFLTQYAQETRMYALVVLLGILACGAFGRAYVLAGTEAAPERGARRRWAAMFAVTLAALMYTHNWSLFFAAGCGLTWLVLLFAARGEGRRELLMDGLIGFGGAVLLFSPWLPTLAFQVQHTGAPWANAPGLDDLFHIPTLLLGTVAPLALLLAAGAGALALLNRASGRFSPRGRALLVIGGLFLATVLVAFAASQVSPAWATRYLAVALPPLLLVIAGGLAHAGRLGLVCALVVAVIWAADGAPTDKSNVRDIAEEIAPSLQPGDLVVSTQPEQIPVLSYYLPKDLRYATLWGPVDDLGVTDWRDGVERLRGTNAQADLKPLIDALPRGKRVVLFEPITDDLSRWMAPWTQLVRVRSTEWGQYVFNDRRLEPVAVRPLDDSSGVNWLRATVLVKD
ncbi:MAG TPA: glycosyltransferase family 39 protein [Solirubrobacteraceae bacterium]|nr:glycosyltransferase family 39 protein [Solirubrobacteraceae bacterium]